ncbi:unannotated protein [freshwater metagenome]|uniref:Unannotated protein n=1 Tax=freshwater metagenome TaxID=449393 RepID=A0A6J6AB44_9ZZZZ
MLVGLAVGAGPLVGQLAVSVTARMAFMRILVAGATGVIGRRLAPLLVAEGHQVWGSTRREVRGPEIRALGVEPVVLDAFDRAAVFSTLDAIRPDVVIYQSTDLASRDFTANGRLRREGAPNLVEAALAAGTVRLIGQSVAFAYGAGDEPATEDEPLDVSTGGSHGDLATDVAMLEQAVCRCPEWVVLRYGILYGPGTWYSADGLVGHQLRNRELTATEGVTSFIHVDDAVRSAAAALSWPSGVVNVVDDEPAAATSWMPIFAARIGAPPPIQRSGREPWERGASNQVLRARVGWSLDHPTWRSLLGEDR